jgi:hypothetical protein
MGNATVIDLGIVGSAQNKTSATTLAVIATKTIPANTLVNLVLGHDNHASATATTATLSNTPTAQAWTAKTAAAQSGATTTAGTGVVHRVWFVRTNAAIAAGATLTTITFGNAIIAKSCMCVGLQNVSTTPSTGSSTNATASTAGTPSTPTTGTAPAAGDVVMAFVTTENTSLTGDSDTLNGSWSPMYSVSTSGSTADTNITVGMQWKQVTASAVQTFNPVGALDTVASIMCQIADAAPATPITLGVPV